MPIPRKKTSSARKTARAPHKDGGGALEVINLEMKGERLKVYSLQTLLTNKKNKETRDVARLGDVLLPWFEKTVSKPAEKLGGVADVWSNLIPAKLRERCRLLGLIRGTLTVAVDAATIRAEVDACLRGGLLRELQTASRGTVYRVKTCVQTLT